MKKSGPATQSVPVYIPERFHADDVLKTLGDRQDRVLQNLKAGMYHVLDGIYKLSLNREHQEDYEIYGGYPLNAQLLQEAIGGNRYLEVLDLLEAAGVITRQPGYTPGSKSKLVRLTEEFDSSRWKVQELPQCTTRDRIVEIRRRLRAPIKLTTSRRGKLTT
jgi:hypothetical protein